MGWGWNREWRPYVSVAEKRRRGQVAARKLTKKGHPLSPIQLAGRQIATTFWGKAWCDNLESYSDYENRLPRGRSYIRNGSVIDLQIEKGKVRALVSGSSLYRIEIGIDPVKPAIWKRIRSECTGKIDSLVELLQGRLSRSVMEVITRRQGGLFPNPTEIELSCSCPDWAEMCKHVAASLYGVGARLDRQPELLFLLRGVDHMELIGAAPAVGVQRDPAAKDREKLLAADSLSEIFGIEIDATAPVKRSKGRKSAPRDIAAQDGKLPPIELPPGETQANAPTVLDETPQETLETPPVVPKKPASRRAEKSGISKLSTQEMQRRSLRMRQYWEAWRGRKSAAKAKEREAAPSISKKSSARKKTVKAGRPKGRNATQQRKNHQSR